MTRFEVPRNWTPQQVEACLDLLHGLYETIWDQYEDVLLPHYLALGMANSKPTDPPELPDHLDPHSYEAEDDIPF